MIKTNNKKKNGAYSGGENFIIVKINASGMV